MQRTFSCFQIEQTAKYDLRSQLNILTHFEMLFNPPCSQIRNVSIFRNWPLVPRLSGRRTLYTLESKALTLHVETDKFLFSVGGVAQIKASVSP